MCKKCLEFQDSSFGLGYHGGVGYDWIWQQVELLVGLGFLQRVGQVWCAMEIGDEYQQGMGKKLWV